MSRLIAIGDVHGCYTALKALVQAMDVQRDDTIVLLGDYVDRGPESSQVIELLVDLVARCHLVPLIGNHELMMVKSIGNRKNYDFWMQNGGDTTIASYGGQLANVPEHHLTFLSHCVRFFDTAQHFFVHASYDAALPLSKQPDELLFWTHIFDVPPSPHISGKKAYVGHTPQSDYEINDFGHVAVLDTFCVGGGWLTAIEVHTQQVWQANQRGEIRPTRDNTKQKTSIPSR